MIKYQISYDERGEIEPCMNCQFEAPTDMFGEYRFCQICASTHLSNAIKYPNLCPDTFLYQSIAWIGNKILSEIKK